MGFFSSIGSVLGGAVGSIFGPVGTVIGAGLGNAAGSAIGGSSADDRYNQQMDFARSQDAFSRQYVQNAIQWRVADAKKAGVHPMAALGISSPQYSAASLPSIPSDSGSIDPMEFGQSLNYAATKAKDRQQQAQMVDLQMKGLELDNEYKQAQIDALKVDTLASSIASNQAWQSPANPTLNATESQGNLPVAPKKDGYIGEPEVQFNPTAHDPNVFTMNAGNDVTGLWEDKDIAGVIPLDLWPLIKANFIDYGSRLRGKIVNGMVYSNARNGWVSVNGPYGKEALADRLGLSNLVKPLRRTLNPRGRETFDPAEYARGYHTF